MQILFNPQIYKSFKNSTQEGKLQSLFYCADVIVGFTVRDTVTVVESVGRVELCVEIFNPAPQEQLDTNLTISVETMSGTAGDVKKHFCCIF